MRKLSTILIAFTALTAAASATDLPRRAAPPPVFTPVPVFTWTGFYAGLNAGYAFDASDDKKGDRYPLPANSIAGLPNVPVTLSVGHGRKSDGFTGGGQVGYNYQFTPGSGFVIGVEADAQYIDFSRRRSSTLNYIGTFNDGSSFAGTLPNQPYVATRGNGLDYFGTVRGRVGYAFDPTLVYATGGFAYCGGGDDKAFKSAGISSSDDFRTGYTVGGGLEYALPTDSLLNFFKSSAVTIKAEGLYVSLDKNKEAVGGVFIPGSPRGLLYVTGANRSTDFAVVRSGVSYKFGTY